MAQRRNSNRVRSSCFIGILSFAVSPLGRPEEHLLDRTNLARSRLLLTNHFLPAPAQLAGKILVAKQLFDPRRKPPRILPRNQKSILSVEEPFADTARVKGYDRQGVAHRLAPDQPKRFRPDRTHRQKTGLL